MRLIFDREIDPLFLLNLYFCFKDIREFNRLCGDVMMALESTKHYERLNMLLHLKIYR